MPGAELEAAKHSSERAEKKAPNIIDAHIVGSKTGNAENMIHSLIQSCVQESARYLKVPTSEN